MLNISGRIISIFITSAVIFTSISVNAGVPDGAIVRKSLSDGSSNNFTLINGDSITCESAVPGVGGKDASNLVYKVSGTNATDINIGSNGNCFFQVVGASTSNTVITAEYSFMLSNLNSQFNNRIIYYKTSAPSTTAAASLLACSKSNGLVALGGWPGNASDIKLCDLEINKWYKVAVTVGTSGNVKIYVNGIEYSVVTDRTVVAAMKELRIQNIVTAGRYMESYFDNIVSYIGTYSDSDIESVPTFTSNIYSISNKKIDIPSTTIVYDAIENITTNGTIRVYSDSTLDALLKGTDEIGSTPVFVVENSTKSTLDYYQRDDIETIINFEGIDSFTNNGTRKNTDIYRAGIASTTWNPNYSGGNNITLKSVTYGFPTDWSGYNYLNQLMYSSKNTGKQVYIATFTGENEGLNRYALTVNWEGWKVVSIPYKSVTWSPFRNPNWTNIYSILYNSSYWNSAYDAEAYLCIDKVWLSKTEYTANEKTLLYVNNPSEITNSHMQPSSYVTKSGTYCGMWANQDIVTGVNIENLPRDLTGFTQFEFWLYSDTGQNSTFQFNVMCDKATSEGDSYLGYHVDVYWKGWHKVTIPIDQMTVARNASLTQANYIYVSSSGWNQTPNPDAVLYFDSIKLKNIDITEADFLQYESRWRFTKIGNEVQNRNDPYIDAQVESYENKSSEIQNMIVKNPSQPLYGEPITGKSAQIGTFYSRIRTMAIAYELESASTHNNADLKADIIYALDWMYDNMYGPATMEGGIYDNWYYFQIDGPVCLLESLMLIKDELTSMQISKYLEPVNYFVPDTVMTAAGTVATGANKVWLTYVAMCSAILERNYEKYQDAKYGLSQVFNYVNGGDGFYTDGSFIQHERIPYNGGYGISLMNYLSNVMFIVSDSKFEITDSKAQNQFDWIFNAFEPLVYKGSVMSMVMGRGISRTIGENYNGATLIKSLLKMIDYAENETVRNRLKSIVKYYVNINSQVGLSVMTLPEIELLRAVLNDSTVTERQNYNLNKTFYNMDRVVHQRENFAVGIAMSSSRICNYEAINQENQRGWYTGDGMTYLYSGDDIIQYSPAYWSLGNPYRRPGTTVDTQVREEIDQGRTMYLSSKDFVGGVSQDLYGAAAMFLDSYSYSGNGTCYDSSGNLIPIPQHNCTLEAQKSWFMFDDEVVALGAGIVSSDNVAVETIIENRKINGNKALSINGQVITYQPGNDVTSSNVQYANIEGIGGYFFPMQIQMKSRKTNTAPAFYEMWINHGINPSNASYAYVILPTKTVEETSLYSINPDIEILSNTNTLQAVRENNLGVTGYIFWTSGTFQTINALMPCIIMITEKDGMLKVSVSDPTHKLSEGNIVINKANLTLETADDGLQINTQPQQTTIQIDFTAKPAGDTFNAEFTE